MPFEDKSDRPDPVEQRCELVPTDVNRYGIKISRQRCEVCITLVAGDEYASIQLYETLIEAAKSGALNLAAIVAAGSGRTS